MNDIDNEISSLRLSWISRFFNHNGSNWKICSDTGLIR